MDGMPLGYVYPKAVSPAELAITLSLSEPYIRELCANGTIEAKKVPSRMNPAGYTYSIPFAELCRLGLYNPDDDAEESP